ncbi:hypothetical protein JCM18899A_03910 [Nocardioides sp. AN3]
MVLTSTGVGAEAHSEMLVLDGTRAPQDLASALVSASMPVEGASQLVVALAVAETRPVLAVSLTELTTPATVTGDGDVPAVELRVEAPPPDQCQVLLEVDGTGVASWHLPLPVGDAAATDRAGGGVVSDVGDVLGGTGQDVFRVPVVQAPLPGPAAPGDGDRALRGIGLSKLLHVLRYPLEQGAGGAAEFLMSHWERTHRPYGLRRYDDGGLAGPAGFRLAADQLSELAGKPTLLLVHGTFATSAGAFGDLGSTLLPALQETYAGRVLLFDHPSVSVSPIDNVRWLLDHTGDTDLVLDVVGHSRGGLVGRALIATPTYAGPLLRPPVVRRLVHVATPNNGTPLASPAKWTRLLDAATNLAVLFPGAGGDALAAVIATVKQLGTGVLDGLHGLESMDPQGAFLTALTEARGTSTPLTFTVASNHEPHPGTVAQRALDVAADDFFSGFLDGRNDLVVPTEGVAEHQPVADAFAVPDALSVTHNGYFAQQVVRDRLALWLPG